MKRLLVQLFGFKKLKLILNNQKTIWNIKFNFVFVALVLSVILATVTYKINTRIDKHDMGLVTQRAADLFDYVENNTVLKTNHVDHIHALLIFQSNPYVARHTMTQVELTTLKLFFEKAQANERINYSELSQLTSLVMNRVKSPKTEFHEFNEANLQEASLLKSYLRLEYYKCKVTAIEADFVRVILTLVDSVGKPDLMPYTTQEEYDVSVERWLRTSDRLITKHKTKLGSVAKVIKLMIDVDINVKQRLIKQVGDTPLFLYKEKTQQKLLAATTTSIKDFVIN